MHPQPITVARQRDEGWADDVEPVVHPLAGLDDSPPATQLLGELGHGVPFLLLACPRVETFGTGEARNFSGDVNDGSRSIRAFVDHHLQLGTEPDPCVFRFGLGSGTHDVLVRHLKVFVVDHGTQSIGPSTFGAQQNRRSLRTRPSPPASGFPCGCFATTTRVPAILPTASTSPPSVSRSASNPSPSENHWNHVGCTGLTTGITIDDRLHVDAIVRGNRFGSLLECRLDHPSVRPVRQIGLP